jgi:8-oxo-dGTP diphosphatase
VLHDGNGWVQCRCGQRHWGRYGAAGLYLTSRDGVLVQLRPEWAHQGGTWSIPGGARDSHETVLEAALREAREEAGVDPASVELIGYQRTQHPDWRYDTVLARTAGPVHVTPHAESVRLAWEPLDSLADLDLHPGFAAALPALRLPSLRVVVDAANVVGSRPDGWWRDRPAAAARLRGELEKATGRTVTWRGRPHLLAYVEMVVEGAARAIDPADVADLVEVTKAEGRGDDTIAARAATLSDVIVVTSDRGLAARVSHAVPVSTLWEWLGG